MAFCDTKKSSPQSGGYVKKSHLNIKLPLMNHTSPPFIVLVFFQLTNSGFGQNLDICFAVTFIHEVFCPFDQKQKLIDAGLLKVVDLLGEVSVKPLGSTKTPCFWEPRDLRSGMLIHFPSLLRQILDILATWHPKLGKLTIHTQMFGNSNQLWEGFLFQFNISHSKHWGRWWLC